MPPSIRSAWRPTTDQHPSAPVYPKQKTGGLTWRSQHRVITKSSASAEPLIQDLHYKYLCLWLVHAIENKNKINFLSKNQIFFPQKYDLIPCSFPTSFFRVHPNTMASSNIGVIQSDTFEADTDSPEESCDSCVLAFPESVDYRRPKCSPWPLLLIVIMCCT